MAASESEPPKGLDRVYSALKNNFLSKTPSTPILPVCNNEQKQFLDCMQKNYDNLFNCKDVFENLKNCYLPERKKEINKEINKNKN